MKPSQMRLRIRRFSEVAAIALVVASAACKTKEDQPPPVKAASAESLVARVDTCPGDGLWHPCVLSERMKRMGFDAKVVDSDTTHVAFLSPPGLHYQIGKSGVLIAFYFADSLSAKKSWLALDTLQLVPPGDTSKPWPSAPFTIHSGNLIAAFFSSSATQAERVTFALRAGVPAPSRAPR